ncbi:RHS repeat-associated core domain-containing protein [Phytohabitans kaempferiae]|uniref:RHS repeat-associated core domain-containing protein n=1 Tax=Phytohabitans kaempferiae TaxID=1620943 RepID=A0ABV6LUN5_9ACTN
MKMGPAAAVVSLLAAGFLVAPEAPVAVAVPPPATVPAAAAQAPPRAAAALPSNPVDYAYDGAGQLRGVTQPAAGGQSARYGYDDGGNLLSIQRSASSALTVISVVPSQAPAGATLTISGTGFATTASANTVRFNGTAATVTQATAVRLTVTVPAGATSGTVTVTTSAGTATSAQPFTVAAAVPTPTVTALSPTRAAAGATVTVTGTGFDTSPGGNIVSFGRTRARVTAATATSLTVTVPEAAGSGRVTVATAGGSATSGSDFVVVPTPYASTAIANTGVLPIDTGSASISVPTAGQVALWRFHGTKGQRLSLGLTGSTFPSNDFRVAIFSPYGAPFARDEFNEPWHYAAFAADPTPTRFAGSILAWNGDGWDLRMRDGTVYVFGDEAPLQEIRDRYGNTVTITRAPSEPDALGVVRAKGPITQLTSPNGKWIKFSHDSADRITRAEDNIGRAVSYTYDTSGRLATVTDANGGQTVYTYESGRLKTIRDARNIVYLTNVYDANGRVQEQTLPDGGTYQFDYVTDASGRVTRTDLTDPRGHVRRVTFNAAGFSTSDTAAHGTPLAQTLQTTRHPTTNLPTSYLDALNRRTDVGYDAYGNVTSVTELAGTAGARTTTIAYGGPFDQVSSVTDALTHSTLYAYQANGALRTVTDPMSRVTTLDSNEGGQITKVTDNDAKATTFGYVLGDLTTVTDPLGRVSRWARDGIARPVRITDPQGNVTRVTYDGFSNVRTVTDPIGRLTDYQYDPNGNLTTVTDPRQNATEYGYDSSDRLHTVTDPLDRVTTYDYDGNGNLETATSARGKVTSYDYDELDRPELVRYGVSGTTTQESQVAYTYDAGNRVRTVVDSAGGTTTITPDSLDRVTRVVSPQGQVDYTYDNADRRATMAVSGQPQVVYGYNNADQLTSVARDAETAAIGYDTVGRRRTLTLPAGVTQTYGYDPASQITSITYTRGSSTLGDLTYDYDETGNPIRVAGSFARGTIPAAYGPASYDNANQLVTNGVSAHAYDPDGNLTSDGTATYTWNARDQLTTYTKPGLTVSYGYDGLGRRSSRDTGGVNTNYLHDGLNVAQEYTGTTPSARLLTGGIDEVFNRTTTGGDRSLLTDALGNTIAGADSASIGVEYTYEPFGATTVTGTDLGNPTRFTGREDDPSGLYYYRARFYSPSAGRFISQDPLGLGSGDTNPYTYVFNQPTKLIDPMGTKPQGSGDCLSNSFTAGTQVLMADGSRKPIEQVKPGDKVMATDPESSESSARPVTAVIKGDGAKTLVEVTVRGQDGSERPLTATDGHPFWVDDDGQAETPGGRWIDAVELRRGQWLKTADGDLVQVAGIHAHTQHAAVYNLTVEGLHTYHVAAGDTSVLVHNCGDAYEWAKPNAPIDVLEPEHRWDPSKGTPVLGRLRDTEIVEGWPDYTYLKLDRWNIARNDAYIQTIINQRGSVLTVSPTKGNYWNKKRQEPTVYAREIQQLLQAGYRWQGDYLMPPV